MNIFYLAFEFLQYCHLKAYEISMIYNEVKMHEEVLQIVKRACSRDH